jgi:hypothetical protein
MRDNQQDNGVCITMQKVFDMAERFNEVIFDGAFGKSEFFGNFFVGQSFVPA